MAHIIITAECESMIRNAAQFPFRTTAVKLPNGKFRVPISDETLERLVEIQHPGESISDTILRTILGSRPN